MLKLQINPKSQVSNSQKSKTLSRKGGKVKAINRYWLLVIRKDKSEIQSAPHYREFHWAGGGLGKTIGKAKEGNPLLVIRKDL